MKTTCAEAQKLSKIPGTKVFWRPNGAVNYKEPGTDLADVTAPEV